MRRLGSPNALRCSSSIANRPALDSSLKFIWDSEPVFFSKEPELFPEPGGEFLMYSTSPSLERRSELRNALIDLGGIVPSFPIINYSTSLK